ncbi:MAG: LPS export ABC transporter permease LptG [Burkholderiaceae bacterium]
MKVLERYFAGEILRSVLFVLVAFLGLFAFFDMIGELQAVGRGGYRLQHAFLYVLLGLPGYAYDLMPIAALIGTIYTLAQFAARSEFTIMRVSSLSTMQAGGILLKIGLVFALITFLLGEFVAPYTAGLAEKVKLAARGVPVSQEFRSGFWTKDIIRKNGLTGEVTGSRFMNVGQIAAGGELRNVRIYEFDRNFRLDAIISAATGTYAGANVWQLSNVVETRFAEPEQLGQPATSVSTATLPKMELVSEVTPEILSVLFSDPDRMSAVDLIAYTRHLSENNQQTKRYDIALWKKIVYPFAVFVMMALALPFAYLHFRSGGVSLKIFTGIMIGVAFQLINSLFSHVGLLSTWPAPATAIVPSALFLLGAIGALWWVEKH